MSVSAKQYLWFGNALVLGLVVWSGVNLGMSILGHRMDAGSRSRSTVEVDGGAETPLKPLSFYETMAQRSIFGGSGKSEAQPAAVSAPKPGMDGDYRLRGTIMDAKSGYYAAIIESAKTREQDLYRPGDRIDEAQILEIEQDHVVLLSGGQKISLHIEDEASPSSASLPRRTLTPPPERDAAAPLARAAGPNQYIVSRDALGRNMTDLNRFMSQVRILPYFKDGQPHGFKIASMNPASPLSQMGFRQGDVIVRVNDVEVGKPEDLINLYHQVQQMENIAVGLERGGQSLDLSYSMR
ncbi:MAG: PDZ domain-containing protein [Proteobacteria bacterium]|nr:PDZ domain-containing protein [Pseudomonadota bacterium]